jgi:hypothetical protein
MLELGKIPAGTECPWFDHCAINKKCVHLGVKSTKPFSCGFARAYNICQFPTDKDRKKLK